MSDRAAWTYTSQSSDVTPPGGLGRMMRRFYQSPSAETVQVDPEDSPADVYYYSPAGEPNSKIWEPLFPNAPGGDLTHVYLSIQTGLTDGSVSVRAERVDGFGAVRQLLSASAPVAATSGSKEFTFQHAAQIGAYQSDRYRLRLRFLNHTLNQESVTYGIGSSFTDLLVSTVIMANPEIVWNSNVVSFPGGLQEYDARPRADRALDFSGGGVSYTALRHIFWQARIALRRFDDAEFQAALLAWWSWASRGKQYAFALDSSEKVDTTLDGSAAAGQKVIPLTSTAGISVGKKYLTREVAGDEYEFVHVDSISAGVSVTARDNLKFGYLSGDLFRSRDYFPKMVSLDDVQPVTEGLTTWDLDHLMREDFG